MKKKEASKIKRQELGLVLRGVRIARGMTLRNASKITGRSFQYLFAVEHGGYISTELYNELTKLYSGGSK